MEYLNHLLFPINTEHLYHTYIGYISQIEHDNRNQKFYIYFKENPTVKFQIYSQDLPNIFVQKEECVLINYQEIVSNRYFTSFYLKSIDLIPTPKSDKFSELTIYCLFCGCKLLLNNFIQCNGRVVKCYEWDDMLLEDVYKSNNCNLCYDNYNGSVGSLCKRKRCRCSHCYTTRIIEY